MARITDFERIENKRPSEHGVVPATYCIFEKDGKKHFQINIYGKADRENPGKVSQTIQFDKEFAKKLITLLNDEFLK
jgi:hypothetical protein